MRTLTCLLLFASTAFLATTFATAEEPKDNAPAAESKVKHRFIASLFRKGQVAMIGEDGKIEWEIPAAHVQDVWMLPNGNVLFSHGRGAKEYDLKKEKVVWEYKAEGKIEVHSCQPLPGGNVLVGECGTSRMVEVGRDGEIKQEIKLKTTVDNVHMQYRCCRKTAKGTYLVAFIGEGIVKELDPDGQVMRTIVPEKDPKNGGSHAVVRLPNGNTLISSGYRKSVVEVDVDGKRVWSVGAEQLPEDFKLNYIAGVQRLSNGNTVVANYAGKPQFFEVTPKHEVVWQVDDPQLSAVAGCLILDVEGEPLR